jgi:3-(3-hydroxy-phenyl)propionate hydroxylase
MSRDELEVAVVGCGPVGALLGNLLGARGISVGIFESEPALHRDPRAFSCDDEALRIYQGAGLLEALVADMNQCPSAEFAGADGRPFACIRFAGLDLGSGHHALNFFHQPVLERVLRDGLSRYPMVSLHLGRAVRALRQDADSVTLTVVDGESGAERELRARYVLGCDGRRSTTRRLAGIPMVGSRYEEPWVALSGTVREPPPSMPICRFVCDPRRPGFVARGALSQCRWEFMLLPEDGVDPDADLRRSGLARRLLAPYIDPDRVELTRATVYTFESKAAARFRDRRVLLLGDAAHTMPPMMGQGLVSGLRDAANLAWKLDLVLRGAAEEALLDTYEQERRPHVQAMSRISERIGSVFMMRNPRLAAVRDRVLRLLDRVPRVHRFTSNAEFKPPPIYEEGAFLDGRHRRGQAQGTLFVQPFVEDAHGRRLRLDDALGPGFAVLSWAPAGAPARTIEDSVRSSAPRLWEALGARFLRAVPAAARASGPDEIRDVEGKLAAWFARYQAAVAVIRPDRFVFGALPAAQAQRLGPALRAQAHAIIGAPAAAGVR